QGEASLPHVEGFQRDIHGVGVRSPMVGPRNSMRLVSIVWWSSESSAKAKLSEIDEPLIERFKLSARDTSKTTVNRYLATLRKALRYASRKLKLIDKTPLIELYRRDKDNTVEREREYVYSTADYQAWLAAAREPLRSASMLAHDAGICRGELLAL